MSYFVILVDVIPDRCNASGNEHGLFLFHAILRANMTEMADAGSDALTVYDGDILLLQELSKEQWMGTKVDRATGRLLYDQHGAIPSTDK